ncbi:MAG: DUF3795 domain-containing protein [bacterium]
MSHDHSKKHLLVGCCGMSCGLCPRFYIVGKSKCLGCSLDSHGFYCSTFKCCNVKKSLETCAYCQESPCDRLNRMKDWKSFNTGKIWLRHNEQIKENGLEEWIKIQNQKKEYLEKALEVYDADRSKNIICLSFTLFDIKTIKKLMEAAKLEITENDKKIKAKKFKILIEKMAQDKKIKLK